MDIKLWAPVPIQSGIRLAGATGPTTPALSNRTDPSMKLNPPSLASARLSAIALMLAFGGDAWSTDLDPSLYRRLGGEPVMTKVVDQLVRTMAADASSDDAGSPADDPALGVAIDPGAFDALVQRLRTALDDHGVGERERNELLRLLAPVPRHAIDR